MADESTRPSRAKRVLTTGIALVHRGELVLPAAGSEAQSERVSDDARAHLEYHFPVEIEVRGGAAAVDEQAIADRVLRLLAARLEREIG